MQVSPIEDYNKVPDSSCFLFLVQSVNIYNAIYFYLVQHICGCSQYRLFGPANLVVLQMSCTSE